MTTVPLLGAYPLSIWLGDRRITLFDIDEAVRLLEEHWPNRTGVHYGRALRSCRLALLRNGPAAVAREHLIAACLESGIPHVFHSGSANDQLLLFDRPEGEGDVTKGGVSRMSLSAAYARQENAVAEP